MTNGKIFNIMTVDTFIHNFRFDILSMSLAKIFQPDYLSVVHDSLITRETSFPAPRSVSTRTLIRRDALDRAVGESTRGHVNANEFIWRTL